LLPPQGNGPFPVILLQHGRSGSKEAEYIDSAAGPWAQRGAAVATIDFPLHGERASTKLGEKLIASLHGTADRSEADEILVREFFHQSVVDLRRAVDALERTPQIDAKRLAYAAFSLGSVIGATFCGLDSRPCAAAFAIGGGGGGPPEFDPAHTIAGFAPRPSLYLNMTRDEVISRESALALFEGSGEPKEHLWFDGTHTELPGEALKAMWLFLRRHLHIA
jgi:dienelactone hydrolase